ncbi:MAG TPA: hypothetical protein PKO15_09355 [Fibrobacteria bacterium]|nr:hypothetical protein [Fibrobacteria bacterium]HOX51745.1 hypothetical protein [Fibrobacteria bacterium]
MTASLLAGCKIGGSSDAKPAPQPGPAAQPAPPPPPPPPAPANPQPAPAPASSSTYVGAEFQGAWYDGVAKCSQPIALVFQGGNALVVAKGAFGPATVDNGNLTLPGAAPARYQVKADSLAIYEPTNIRPTVYLRLACPDYTGPNSTPPSDL